MGLKLLKGRLLVRQYRGLRQAASWGHLVFLALPNLPMGIHCVSCGNVKSIQLKYSLNISCFLDFSLRPTPYYSSIVLWLWHSDTPSSGFYGPTPENAICYSVSGSPRQYRGYPGRIFSGLSYLRLLYFQVLFHFQAEPPQSG